MQTDKQMVYCMCVYSTHTHIIIQPCCWNLAAFNNMDESRGHFAKWSKSDWETSDVWFHLYVESKKQNEWTNKTEIRIFVIKKNLVAARGEGSRG